MYNLIFNKFNDWKFLANNLLKTDDEELVEGNWWHDNFYGDCYCERCKDIVGENHHGKILMKVRDCLK